MSLKRLLISFIALSLAVLAPAAGASAATRDLSSELSGRILLQVEQHGEAYYIDPTDGLRHYLRDGATAYQVMRELGLGITDTDLASIPSAETPDEIKASETACASNSVAKRVSGRILLQVEQHGEAWYVDPVSCHRIYMKDGDAAYQLMRELGLGIVDADLDEVPESLRFENVRVLPDDLPEDARAFLEDCEGEAEYESGEGYDLAGCRMSDPTLDGVIARNHFIKEANAFFVLSIPAADEYDTLADGQRITAMPLMVNLFCDALSAVYFDPQSLINRFPPEFGLTDESDFETNSLDVYLNGYSKGRLVIVFQIEETEELIAQCSSRQAAYDAIEFTDFRGYDPAESLIVSSIGEPEGGLDVLANFAEALLSDVARFADLSDEELEAFETLLEEDLFAF